MASFYSNENIPMGLVEALRGLGHDVLTSFDAGNANRGVPDEEVLRFCTGQDRVLLTLNRRHFKRLHRSTRGEHSGIVSCSQDPDHAALANRIDCLTRECGRLSGKHLAVYASHFHLED